MFSEKRISRTSWISGFNKNKTENVLDFALKFQQLYKKGWCNESALPINLKCNEIFTTGLPKNWKTFLINGRSNIHLLLWNLSFHFKHWLNLLIVKILQMKRFELVFYHLDLFLEHQKWNIKFYSLKVMIGIVKSCLLKQLNRIVRKNLSVGNSVVIVIYPFTLFQIVSRKQCEDGEGKRNFFCRSKSSLEAFNQYFEAYRNQIHPNQQTSCHPVNYSSSNSYHSGNSQIPAIDILHIYPVVLDHLQLQVIDVKFLVLDFVIVIENWHLIELHHVQDILNIITIEETLDILNCFPRNF